MKSIDIFWYGIGKVSIHSKPGRELRISIGWYGWRFVWKMPSVVNGRYHYVTPITFITIKW